jgi:hypothetical protein
LIAFTRSCYKSFQFEIWFDISKESLSGGIQPQKVGNEIFNVFIQNYHEKVKKLSAFLFRTYDEVVLR